MEPLAGVSSNTELIKSTFSPVTLNNTIVPNDGIARATMYGAFADGNPPTINPTLPTSPTASTVIWLASECSGRRANAFFAPSDCDSSDSVSVSPESTEASARLDDGRPSTLQAAAAGACGGEESARRE